MLICAVLQGYADFFAPLFYMGGYEAKVRKNQRKVHYFLYLPSIMQSRHFILSHLYYTIIINDR